MSLATPENVQKLQMALHDKAKKSPNFRFYALYDKVYRKDVLTFAYACSKANGGAAGVDGQTFEDIEAYGVERWLNELTQELKSQTYRPLPVRRVWIPKPDGKTQRPLGVPAIRDRVPMMAAVLVLDPIFEADLQPEQYAYRRDRSALDAVRHVHKLINTGHVEIVDADLASYFDSLPHSELLKSVARRVVDGAMLHLIKMWLTAPVEETDERGKKHRNSATGMKAGDRLKALQSARCSVISTCAGCAGVEETRARARLGASIVNYADDLVICCRGRAEEALAAMRVMMTKLKLTVNEAKTRVANCRKTSSIFWDTRSDDAIRRRRVEPIWARCRQRSASCVSVRRSAPRPDKTSSRDRGSGRKLNRMMTGWANYFCLGPVSKAYRAIERHARVGFVSGCAQSTN